MDEDGMRIGEALREARTRQGLEISEIENETKIRARYLRALENEQWEVLPSSAYVSGFLRTYAQLLGLDGDALVDEYRRQGEVEGVQAAPTPYREPGRGGRPGGERGPRLWAILALAAVAVIAALIVIGLIGGSDERAGKRAAHARQEREQRRQRRERRQEKRKEQRQAEQAAMLSLRMVMNSDLQICLVGEDESPLIDSQVVAAGSEEGPYEAERFDISFPSGYDQGSFDLFVDDQPTTLPETVGPVAFRIKGPDRIRRISFSGDCP